MFSEQATETRRIRLGNEPLESNSPLIVLQLRERFLFGFTRGLKVHRPATLLASERVGGRGWLVARRNRAAGLSKLPNGAALAFQDEIASNRFAHEPEPTG